MPKAIDLTGRVFGNLTVIRYIGHRGRHRAWLCECKCGNRIEVPTCGVPQKTSCGCIRNHGTWTHAMTGTPTWRTWQRMKARCVHRGSVGYKNYGGRGITMCSRWRDSFEAFLEDMGPRPAEHSIDRIDSDGNYEPGNCRWATQREQSRNKRTSRFVTVEGLTLTYSEWSDRLGGNKNCVQARVARGWSEVDAVLIPLNHRRGNREPRVRTITVDGLTLSIGEWADRIGATRTTIHARLTMGWSEADAVLTSLKRYRSRGSR